HFRVRCHYLPGNKIRFLDRAFVQVLSDPQVPAVLPALFPQSRDDGVQERRSRAGPSGAKPCDPTDALLCSSAGCKDCAGEDDEGLSPAGHLLSAGFSSQASSQLRMLSERTSRPTPTVWAQSMPSSMISSSLKCVRSRSYTASESMASSPDLNRSAYSRAARSLGVRRGLERSFSTSFTSSSPRPSARATFERTVE